MKVEALMQRDVVSVTPETCLKEVARLLAARGFSGMPVVTADGTVVGVVSEADIIVKEQGRGTASPGLLGRLVDAAVGERRFPARTAGEAMTTPALTITPGEQVSAAARTMVERRVNRLPVVDGEKLVGIISRGDLVRAFQRTDVEIEREIVEDVLRETLWIPDGAVEVSVEAGVVDLWGTVETRTDAEIAEAFVSRVPGVVDVHAVLAWKVDDQSRRARHAADRIPSRV